MTSYEIIQLLDQITLTLNEKTHLMALLSQAEEYRSNIKKTVDEVVGGENQEHVSHIARLRGNVTNIFAPNFKRVRPRAVFAELDVLVDELSAFRGLLQEPAAATLDNLVKEIGEFSRLYEEFNDAPALRQTFNLIDAGDRLLKSIQSFTGPSLLLRNTLRPIEFNLDGYQEFSLLLSATTTYTYGDLLTKLTALHTIYSELCNLISVSPSEHPLLVSKVESGSLWVRVFGESKVITLLTKLTQAGAAYMYRRYTTEGKVAAIPKQVESVESVLRLAERLESMGIDTSDMKENLQKSGNAISSNLNKLLRGEPSVTVNGQLHSLKEELQDRYLQESKVLLLDDGGDKQKD